MMMIAASEMLVVWNVDDATLRITDLRVVRHDDETVSSYQYTDGACWCDWLKAEDTTRHPIGLYARLASQYGFPDAKAARAALDQFALVAGQAWARDLNRSMDELGAA